jgi:hypothetical protein
MEKQFDEKPALLAGQESQPTGDTDYQHGTITEIDHVAEKKVLRKIDINLITLFGVCLVDDKEMIFINVRRFAGPVSHELSGLVVSIAEMIRNSRLN